MGQVFDYIVAQYLQPIGDVYEAAYLCSVFLLVNAILLPPSQPEIDTSFPLITSSFDMALLVLASTGTCSGPSTPLMEAMFRLRSTGHA